MLKRDLYYERISTKSLRDDVRYLGNILGRVIKDQEGKKFFDLVEKTRLLSKANIANKNQKDPFNKISKEIKKCNPKNLFKSVSSFIENPNKIKEQIENTQLILKTFKTDISSSKLASKALSKFL